MVPAKRREWMMRPPGPAVPQKTFFPLWLWSVVHYVYYSFLMLMLIVFMVATNALECALGHAWNLMQIVMVPMYLLRYCMVQLATAYIRVKLLLLNFLWDASVGLLVAGLVFVRLCYNATLDFLKKHKGQTLDSIHRTFMKLPLIPSIICCLQTLIFTSFVSKFNPCHYIFNLFSYICHIALIIPLEVIAKIKLYMASMARMLFVVPRGILITVFGMPGSVFRVKNTRANSIPGLGDAGSQTNTQTTSEEIITSKSCDVMLTDGQFIKPVQGEDRLTAENIQRGAYGDAKKMKNVENSKKLHCESSK